MDTMKHMTRKSWFRISAPLRSLRLLLIRDGDKRTPTRTDREAMGFWTTTTKRILERILERILRTSARIVPLGSLFLIALFAPRADAADGRNGFVKGRYTTMEYQFFKPPAEDSDTRYPLIVGLHGAGRREQDISRVLMEFHWVPASPQFQKQQRCYILAPKTKTSWFPKHPEDPRLTQKQIADLPPYWGEQYGETIKKINNPPEGGFGDLDILFELIDTVIAENDIDPNRIYVVGFSMGGTGTWQAIAARPKFFAAAIPAAGGRVYPWQWNSEMLSVPIWAFQGSKDRTTVAARHQVSFDYAKNSGGNMKYTIFEGAGHGIVPYMFTPTGDIQYEGTYKTLLASEACDREENVWRWLFSQKLK